MKMRLATGGSVGNAIFGLACLGAGTGFIEKAGNGYYGDFLRKNLQNNNIEDNLSTSEQFPLGMASTFISRDGERTSGIYLRATASLKVENLTLEMFKGYAYLFIKGYLVQDHEMILYAIELAKKAGLQICLDMVSYNIMESDLEFFSLLINKYVDIVFANEEEAKAFTGEEPEEAPKVVAKKYSIATAKIRANGSYIRRDTEETKVSAIPVEGVLDTTGTGDYFAARFLYGLTCGYSPEKCTKVGSVLSGNVIQVIGTTIPPECRDEIKLNINKVLAEQPRFELLSRLILMKDT